jgi:1-deoxy-D-xylulose-5-phosphate synthase
MAYEGLNNGSNGNEDLNLIIILNQNDMSISPNTGGLADYLNSVRQREGYVNTKLALQKNLDRSNIGKGVKNFMSRSKNAIKGAFLGENIFEALGYIYIGIVDGHNIEAIENALNIAKLYHKPVVVHVHTTKGKGYYPAEKNPNLYHGISSFDILTGKPTNQCTGITFSKAFGKKMVELGEKDSKVCAITAAMGENTGLSEFRKKFPNRFFDVGIAEQHAVTFASGMASMGIVPVFAVYSTFLQRSYDQIIHDVAIAETHIVLAIDRAGIVGEDGETHQGIFDVAFLSNVPNCVIYSPSSIDELNVCLEKSIHEEQGLVCVRYPRGVDNSTYPKGEFAEYSLEKHIGAETLLVTYGRTYEALYQATAKLNGDYIFCDLLKLTKIFPIPKDSIKCALGYKRVIFFEEGIQSGGLGEHFLYELVTHGYHGDFKLSAIDGFVYAGSVESCLARYNLTSETMYSLVKETTRKGVKSNES